MHASGVNFITKFIIFLGGNPYEAEMEAEIQEEFIRREDRNNIQTREMQCGFEVGTYIEDE